VNRKKASDATVDINDSKKGDPARMFIIQVAAFSWASIQVPEITAAIQSFLNAGFRSAVQVQFEGIKIRALVHRRIGKSVADPLGMPSV
jgi:hypothetical protein